MSTVYIAPVGSDPADRSNWREVGVTTGEVSWTFDEEDPPVPDWSGFRSHTISVNMKPTPLGVRWFAAMARGRRSEQLPRPHPPVKAIGRHRGRVERARRLGA